MSTAAAAAPTSSVSTSSNETSQLADTFVETCETYGVDSRLLYNDIEQLSNRRFHYTSQLVAWSRVLTVAAVAAAGVAGLASYYQRAKIHRVWRLRNPKRVQQLSWLMFGSGGFSACTLLFLISPIGLMRLHDAELQRTRQLDAIAVLALVQEQNFQTLAAWGREAAASTKTAAGVRASRVSDHHSRATHSFETSDGAAPLWVWKEVVLDPTQLQGHAVRNSNASKKDAHTEENASTVAVTESSASTGEKQSQKEEKHKTTADAGRDAVKQQMAAELLLPDATVEETERENTTPAPQRQVWTHTTDPATLRAIFNASAAMWELLVAEKAVIEKRVF